MLGVRATLIGGVDAAESDDDDDADDGWNECTAGGAPPPPPPPMVSGDSAERRGMSTAGDDDDVDADAVAIDAEVTDAADAAAACVESTAAAILAAASEVSRPAASDATRPRGSKKPPPPMPPTGARLTMGPSDGDCTGAKRCRCRTCAGPAMGCARGEGHGDAKPCANVTGRLMCDGRCAWNDLLEGVASTAMGEEFADENASTGIRLL